MADEPSALDFYDISETANYLIERGFTRVALQFPDGLLKDSTAVVAALRNELERRRSIGDSPTGGSNSMQLYVLADTTYGSCCSDEIAASHVNAECIVHYGHTCLSRTSILPVWCVFGKALIDYGDCARQLNDYALMLERNLLVLYGLEYAYAIPLIQKITTKEKAVSGCNLKITFAEVPHREIEPTILRSDRMQHNQEKCTAPQEASIQDAHLEEKYINKEQTKRLQDHQSEKDSCSGEQLQEDLMKTMSEIVGELGVNGNASLGGLKWSLPEHNFNMEDVLTVWIGQEGPALTNIILTFNKTAVVRYDPEAKVLLTDVANQSKVLSRRYYLVERAKDANIVGIVVGTLGVAGYCQVIGQIRRLVKEAGKKPYTLVMGKPSPSKLANFPECDVFVLVACAQTALLDSKEFMAPLITPFEAVLAFTRGSQWTGAYHLDFGAVMRCSVGSGQISDENHEARFSFLKGGYIEDKISQESESIENSSRAMVLSSAAEQALQLHANSKQELAANMVATSGSEFFSRRNFQGLEIQNESKSPIQPAVPGRKGRASVYEGEI